MNTERKIFSDTLLVAYLHFKNFSVKPLNNSQKLISFEVEGENLSDAISEFYANPKIPILGFIQSFKTIRSMVFNLKEGQR